LATAQALLDHLSCFWNTFPAIHPIGRLGPTLKLMLIEMFEARTPKEVADSLTRHHKEALSGIIAIDGKDGAGKDCLALNLRKLIGGEIVSLDYYIQQKNQGGYVPYLNLTEIRAAIEACATPKIVAGCCMLEVLNSIGHKQDALIYAKRVVFYPDGCNCYWLDDEVLHHQKAVSENDTLTEEIVRYHDTFNPLHISTIAFLHSYKKFDCPFHLE
jgi:hypothetical protein